MKKVLVVSLIMLSLFLVACSSKPALGTQDLQAPETSTNSNSVTIENFAFSPTTLTIQKGTTVTWTNQDSAPHTVTSDSGSELSSASLSKGQSYSHTFDQAGTFTYHCNFHSMMKAKVVVE